MKIIVKYHRIEINTFKKHKILNNKICKISYSSNIYLNLSSDYTLFFFKPISPILHNDQFTRFVSMNISAINGD